MYSATSSSRMKTCRFCGEQSDKDVINCPNSNCRAVRPHGLLAADYAREAFLVANKQHIKSDFDLGEYPRWVCLTCQNPLPDELPAGYRCMSCNRENPRTYQKGDIPPLKGGLGDVTPTRMAMLPFVRYSWLTLGAVVLAGWLFCHIGLPIVAEYINFTVTCFSSFVTNPNYVHQLGIGGWLLGHVPFVLLALAFFKYLDFVIDFLDGAVYWCLQQDYHARSHKPERSQRMFYISFAAAWVMALVICSAIGTRQGFDMFMNMGWFGGLWLYFGSDVMRGVRNIYMRFANTDPEKANEWRNRLEQLFGGSSFYETAEDRINGVRA